MDTGPIRPARGFYSPVNLLVGCQGRVTAALDAQDHGMVICAFPKSISSPGMMPASQRAKKPESSGSRDGGTSMASGTDPPRRVEGGGTERGM